MRKIDDLYFGIKRVTFLAGELRTENLFDIHKVKRSVALYVMMTEEERKRLNDPVAFCFGDVWGRCEYEMVISDWPNQRVAEKYDIYTLYVEPNARHLMDLVNSVSKSSATRWLREDRKKY